MQRLFARSASRRRLLVFVVLVLLVGCVVGDGWAGVGRGGGGWVGGRGGGGGGGLAAAGLVRLALGRRFLRWLRRIAAGLRWAWWRRPSGCCVRRWIGWARCVAIVAAAPSCGRAGDGMGCGGACRLVLC